MIPNYIWLPQMCLLLHEVDKDTRIYRYTKYKCRNLRKYIEIRKGTKIDMAKSKLNAATFQST